MGQGDGVMVAAAQKYPGGHNPEHCGPDCAECCNELPNKPAPQGNG